MEQVQGWSEAGGTSVVVPGTQGSGSQRFQQSFRGCTVTVRDSSNNLATIYSDDLASPTAKANPFTSSSTTGLWSFYTTTGSYSITFSGGAITAPFSITVNVGLGNAGGVPSYAYASLPTSKTQNAGDLARVTDVIRAVWTDTGVQWVSLIGNQTTPEWFGAIDDGSTDSRTAVNNALLAGKNVNAESSHFVVNGTMNLAVQTLLSGGFYQDNSNAAEFVIIPVTSTRVTIQNVKVLTGTGIAVHQNRANNTDVFLSFPRVTAGGYAILSNENSDGGDGFMIIGGQATSSAADAVQFNNPGDATALGTNYHYSAIGLLLSSGNFAFGVSGTLGWAAIGNHIRTSTLEAFHIEHSQRRGIIGFNTAKACLADGMQLLPALSADPDEDPVIVIGNHLLHTGAASTFCGLKTVINAQGQTRGNAVVGNVFAGFGFGYQSALETHAVLGNVLLNCTTGINSQRQSILVGGGNVSRGCTNLGDLGAASIVDQIASTAAPTEVAIHSDGRAIGGVLKKFSFPVVGSHTGGGGAENVVLFKTGTRFRGVITVMVDNNATGLFYSAPVLWDGTTLTVTSAEEIEHYSGAISAGTFNASGGNVRFNFVSSVALTDVNFITDFEGIYYQT